MASSPRSTPLSNIERDVFGSYCFQDTGTNFTSHLKSAFDKEGIITFIDDRQDGGEEISESLSNKISESLVSVLVFSENYGGSPRCLNELLEIVRCMREYERHVLPVFRGVEPSHVRKQEGAFGEAFQKMLTLNQQLKADKEEKWRSALVEAADLSGWDSQNTSSEADMINKVVERIKVMVNKQYSEVFDDGFVGIEQVKKVESLLHLELTKDVQSLGIWGTGGVGKTTIARKVYSRIKNQFNGACFLSNVGDRLGRKELDYLCTDMLKELLRSQNLQGPLDLATMSVKNALRRNKFLFVFDDVTYSPQLKDLVKPHRFYGPGSRIILTSRDKQMLKNFDCKEHIYEVKELNHPEALRLFKFHAFKQQPCSEWYKKLSEKALRYAKGLPLVLEVLGCNLHGKQVEEWESELEKLEEIPDRTINDILMISFAGLDKMEKRIFLDIACVVFGLAERSSRNNTK